MKSIILRGIFIMAAFAIVGYIIFDKLSSQSLESKREKASIENKIQAEQTIFSMVTRHNAIADWDKEFSRKEVLRGQAYTVEVEDALIKSDGRSVLIFVNVDDVVRRGDKYYLHLSRSGYLDLDVRFVLECNSEQVKKVMEQKTSYREHYAVIALISSVQRPNFSVEASPVNSEEAEIVVDSSDIFIAMGRCLDLLFVGDYKPTE